MSLDNILEPVAIVIRGCITERWSGAFENEENTPKLEHGSWRATTWKSKDGRRTPMHRMSNRHVENIVGFLSRKIAAATEDTHRKNVQHWRARRSLLLKELEYRSRYNIVVTDVQEEAYHRVTRV